MQMQMALTSQEEVDFYETDASVACSSIRSELQYYYY